LSEPCFGSNSDRLRKPGLRRIWIRLTAACRFSAERIDTQSRCTRAELSKGSLRQILLQRRQLALVFPDQSQVKQIRSSATRKSRTTCTVTSGPCYRYSHHNR
jgi:hypothetical protein